MSAVQYIEKVSHVPCILVIYTQQQHVTEGGVIMGCRNTWDKLIIMRKPLE
jgi:hypothetical protein